MKHISEIVPAALHDLHKRNQRATRRGLDAPLGSQEAIDAWEEVLETNQGSHDYLLARNRELVEQGQALLAWLESRKSCK